MARFQVTARTTLPPAEAWVRLTDWPAHAHQVPFTNITVVEDGFVARTALGRVGFDDPMRIVRWSPPGEDGRGSCRLEKQGRVVLGWAELSVVPDGAGTRATWVEDVRVARLPRVLDRATAGTAGLLFGRVLRRLIAADR